MTCQTCNQPIPQSGCDRGGCVPVGGWEAPELDARKCDDCDGRGWYWKPETVVHRQGGEYLGTEHTELKHECETCDGVGYCGPDAVAFVTLMDSNKDEHTGADGGNAVALWIEKPAKGAMQ